MRPMPRLTPAIAGALALLSLAQIPSSGAARAAAPPVQPADGPGGLGDKAAAIAKRVVGAPGSDAYVFHKAGAAPSEGRPVAVFLHAWGAPNPQGYGAWIDHLARNGWLVVFPRFQEVNRTRPADATANAERALKDVLGALAADAEAKPDAGRVALIGHLAGVPLAANLAAAGGGDGMPAARLVFGVMPGGIAHDAKSRGIALADLARIPADTILVTVVGDRDARAAEAAARRILRDASGVRPERKLFLRALSDDHGFPALTATLAAPAGLDAAYDGGAIKGAPETTAATATKTSGPKPAGPAASGPKPAPFKWSPDMALTGEQTTLVSQINNARADSLDYLAFWRTFDMAAAAAFGGRDAQSLRNDARFSDMQRWSDGWPVKRLTVETPKPAVSPPSVQR